MILQLHSLDAEEAAAKAAPVEKQKDGTAAKPTQKAGPATEKEQPSKQPPSKQPLRRAHHYSGKQIK
jgi:hypothetical protein